MPQEGEMEDTPLYSTFNRFTPYTLPCPGWQNRYLSIARDAFVAGILVSIPSNTLRKAELACLKCDLYIPIKNKLET